MDTKAKQRREYERAILEAERRIIGYNEELMAFSGEAWERLRKVNNEQLSYLHRLLVDSDEPEWKFRQLQGQARVIRDALRAPDTIQGKIRKAEEAIADAKANLERLSR